MRAMMFDTQNASIEMRTDADAEDWRWCAWCEKSPERFVKQLNSNAGWIKYRVRR